MAEFFKISALRNDYVIFCGTVTNLGYEKYKKTNRHHKIFQFENLIDVTIN